MVNQNVALIVMLVFYMIQLEKNVLVIQKKIVGLAMNIKFNVYHVSKAIIFEILIAFSARTFVKNASIKVV